MGEAWKLVQEGSPRVWQVANTIFPSNCYICETGLPGRCLLIDPGLEAGPIEAALDGLQLKPSAVLCTHGHFDHAGSARYFEQTYDCPVYLHAADQKTLNAANFLMMAFKIPARIELPVAVYNFDAFILVDDRAIKVHHTPGHTPGSCIFEIGDAVFTGDTLYASGVGLSKLPGENPDLLRRSLHHALDVLPRHATAHPGHGRSAALQWIIENNADLREFLDAPLQYKAS